ncbi:MAG: SMP-30/gluconolactonase/LRE family protein [Pseudomonadota bacterium]
MRELNANCVWPVGAELGEGPLWVAEEQRMYFVDIKRGKLHALDVVGGERHSWSVPGLLCWIVARRDGDGFMAGLGDCVARLWPERHLRLESLALDFALGRDVRLNDAKADRFGNIWAGSMNNLDYSRADGRLFRLAPDLGLSVAGQGLHIANGPAFSADGATMYHTDTFLGRIHSYPVDAGGIAGVGHLWRQFGAAGEGGPDGMCCDAEGGLWVAQWGGARVCRYLADGTLDTVVHLPVSHVSSCAFGGAGLRTLYITSARQELGADRLADEPLAGGLFAVELDVAGAPAFRFG